MPKTDWTRLLKPEDKTELQERLRKLRHEFEIYRLRFTERMIGAIKPMDGYPGNDGRRVARLMYEGLHVEVEDYGPLSFWRIEEVQPGAKNSVAGGDSICFEVARVEAAEALLELLNAKAARAAEALTEPPSAAS